MRSEGALCVFFDDVLGPDGTPSPLIVQKSNGGFGYAATDLAAIRNRVGRLGADTLPYVVDARQALHFRFGAPARPRGTPRERPTTGRPAHLNCASTAAGSKSASATSWAAPVTPAAVRSGERATRNSRVASGRERR